MIVPESSRIANPANAANLAKMKRSRAWRAGRAAAALAIAFAAACARPYPEDQIPRMKILIMDLETPPGVRENPREVRGWWFGARTVYQNPRAGTMFADRLTAKVSKFSFANVFTRPDLKYYFANKRQGLKERYDYLEDSEIDDLMRQVPASDFARELGADKVVSGRIVEDYLSENRTIHSWRSRAKIELQVADAQTGRVEWEGEYELKRWFASQLTVHDQIAEQVADDLKEGYFKQLALASAR